MRFEDIVNEKEHPLLKRLEERLQEGELDDYRGKYLLINNKGEISKDFDKYADCNKKLAKYRHGRVKETIYRYLIKVPIKNTTIPTQEDKISHIEYLIPINKKAFPKANY